MEERRALYHKYKELQDQVHDVEFTILESDFKFGEDVVFKVKVFNREKQRHVVGKIICKAVTYTGRYSLWWKNLCEIPDLCWFSYLI